MASCIATSQTTALPLDECAGPAIPLQTVHSLTFDAPTNRADMFGVEPCSAVLDAQSLAMLQGEDEDEPESPEADPKTVAPLSQPRVAAGWKRGRAAVDGGSRACAPARGAGGPRPP